MIVDDLRASSVRFRILTQEAQVVRVPYEVAPFTDQPDGEFGMWWKGWGHIKDLIPMDKSDRSIDCSWWRPPFRDMVIVSEQHENGCLLVLGPIEPVKELVRFEGEQETSKPEWATMLALIAKSPDDGRPLCQLAFQVVAHRDRLAQMTRDQMINMTVMVNELLLGRIKREDLRVHLEHTWSDPKNGTQLDVDNMTAIFSVTCALMSCKNVETERHRAPEKLQKARIRRGHLPLVSWHVLKVRPHSKPRTASKGAGTSEPVAIHLVRGHFKTYTKERPLLGRAVGTYWWQPHIAGRADRVMLKDYEVEP